MAKNYKVLVTGAGGFIGSHLCDMLLEFGYDVYPFVHYNSKNSWGWLEISEYKNEFKIIAGDIRDFDSVFDAVHKVDAVLHLAALIGIPYSYVSPLAYIRTNVEGTYNILEAAQRQGKKRVIHTSTSETYGTAQYVPIDEKHPLVGQSPYSASKIGADQLALSYSLSFNLPVTIIRPFNTYGPRQSMRAVIPTIITQIIAGKQKLELGNTTPTRDFTYVTDTCRGFTKALETDNGAGKIINIGVGKDISIKDIAHKIMDIMGKKIEILSAEERIRPNKSEVERLQSDNSLAKKLLGWEPRVSLDEGLKNVVEFVLTNVDIYKIGKYII